MKDLHLCVRVVVLYDDRFQNIKAPSCRDHARSIKEGVLRNHDGYGDEKVTSSYKFELFQLVFHVVSILFMSYNIGEVCNNHIMYRFEAKREKERLILFVHVIVKT